MQNTSRVGDFFKNKWVRLGIAVDVLIIIAVIAVAIYNSMKSSVISFNVAPIDATISVNGDASYSNGVYEFLPGQYEITVSHPDLDSKSFTITLEPQSSTELTTFLSASDDFEFYQLKNNFDSFSRLASIASKEDNRTTDHDTSAETFISEYNKNIELYGSKLPINEVTRGDPDAVPAVARAVNIFQNYDEDCVKYLCISAYTIGIDDPNFVDNLLVDIGFNMNYMEIKND